MPHGKMTATDDEIRSMLAEGHSVLHTSKTLHCGLTRVRRVRDGKEAQRSQCDRDRVYAWCDGHELGGLTPGQRAAAIVEDLGVSETTARRWEYAWRTERGDVAPMPTQVKPPREVDNADAVAGTAEAARPAGGPTLEQALPATIEHIATLKHRIAAENAAPPEFFGVTLDDIREVIGEEMEDDEAVASCVEFIDEDGRLADNISVVDTVRSLCNRVRDLSGMLEAAKSINAELEAGILVHLLNDARAK